LESQQEWVGQGRLLGRKKRVTMKLKKRAREFPKGLIVSTEYDETRDGRWQTKKKCAGNDGTSLLKESVSGGQEKMPK